MDVRGGIDKFRELRCDEKGECGKLFLTMYPLVSRHLPHCAKLRRCKCIGCQFFLVKQLFFQTENQFFLLITNTRTTKVLKKIFPISIKQIRQITKYDISISKILQLRGEFEKLWSYKTYYLEGQKKVVNR